MDEKWELLQKSHREEYLEWLSLQWLPREHCLPAGFTLAGKSQEEIELAQGGGAWRWYNERAHRMHLPGSNIPSWKLPLPPVRLPDGRYVQSHSYTRPSSDSAWVETDAQPDLLDPGEHLQTLEVQPYCGFLCMVIIEWIACPDQGSYPQQFLDDQSFEGKQIWEDLITRWPALWKDSASEHLSSPDGFTRSIHPITGLEVPQLLQLVDGSDFGGIIDQIRIELAACGLPWDLRMALYTLWRILGGERGDAPEHILPERGGWVETLVVAHSQDTSNTSLGITYSEALPLFGESVFEQRTLLRPYPIQSTIVSGAWVRDERWDTAAGVVRAQHQAWIDEQIQKSGLELPLNDHQRSGKQLAQSGLGKRGRPVSDVYDGLPLDNQAEFIREAVKRLRKQCEERRAFNSSIPPCDEATMRSTANKAFERRKKKLAENG